MLLLVSLQTFLLGILLHDDALDDVAVNAGEMALLEFLLKH